MRILSKAQTDRLGERLKSGGPSEADLRQLDQYRQSFSNAYEQAVSAIRGTLGLEPTGRPAKSTPSIADKLRRESIRLSQTQDIAGCRVVVPDVAAQDGAVRSLLALFPTAHVVDRRLTPSHGYRAVHIVPRVADKPIEVQVRSALQHLWAELSEKYSDVVDPSIKYGGGEALVQGRLVLLSKMVARAEKNDAELARLQRSSSMASLQAESVDIKRQVADLISGMIEDVTRGRGGHE